jgi:hypothetical protein
LPYFVSAISKPRTLPGTPEERHPSILSTRRIALGVEVHVARRFFRRPLTEIDERRPAVGEANQHVTAAADVSGERMRHRHRETDCDRRVDRVAALL